MTVSIRPEVLDKIREEQELNSDEALARHLGLSLGTIQGLSLIHISEPTRRS